MNRMCYFVALFLTQTKATWKEEKLSHFESLRDLSSSSINFFANSVQNETDFRKHLDQILIPRASGTAGNRKVREYIANILNDLGYTVEISSSEQPTPAGPITFHNVIATLDSSAPRRLTVACHYDTKRETIGFVGATDSAVPCSQMLNLATTLRNSLDRHKNQNNEVTLQFVFFDGEEAVRRWTNDDNTYGSRDLAQKWENQRFFHENEEGTFLDRMDMLMLLDLIGETEPTFHSYDPKTNDWYERLVDIESVLDSSNFTQRNGKRSMFSRQTTYFRRVEDDHIHFRDRDVPTLHLIDVPFPDVWHKIEDDISALDFLTISDLNKIFRVFIAEYFQLEE